MHAMKATVVMGLMFVSIRGRHIVETFEFVFFNFRFYKIVNFGDPRS